MKHLIIGLAVLFFGVSQASASTIEIQLAGLNVVYDGSAVADAGGSNPEDADPLDTVNFRVDGSLVGTYNSLETDLYASFEFGPIEEIPITGGTVSTGLDAGYFDLLMPDIGLALELDDASVTYLPTGAALFVFAGSLANVADQDLPLGLVIGDPVHVSFSTQIESKTDDGDYLTGFTASGTGEIRGEQIPEPSTLIMLCVGVFALLLPARRKRQ